MNVVKVGRDCLSSALVTGSARNGSMGVNEYCILSPGGGYVKR
jgi:hypothetical protein